SLDRTQPGVRTLQACGPEVFTLKQLVQLSGALAGLGHGRPVLPLPHWLGLMQAWLLERMPGEPLMSRDNLRSLLLPNVAVPGMPGLQELGIQPAALLPIASVYLSRS
ncbi:MAG: complex I NDUFA9 subunit family protein, partial [Rhodoferax sp.]|nr:complex I NDUFA9 subunit family protein [Rhodoferax sp.]